MRINFSQINFSVKKNTTIASVTKQEMFPISISKKETAA